MQLQVDWNALLKDVGLALVAEIQPILKAEGEDVRAFGFAIAKRMVAAVQAGDKAWTEELRAQMKGLGELLRIRANAGAWDMVEQISRIVFKVLLAAASAAK